jgi:hypothetical protein
MLAIRLDTDSAARDWRLASGRQSNRPHGVRSGRRAVNHTCQIYRSRRRIWPLVVAPAAQRASGRRPNTSMSTRQSGRTGGLAQIKGPIVVACSRERRPRATILASTTEHLGHLLKCQHAPTGGDTTRLGPATATAPPPQGVRSPSIDTPARPPATPEAPTTTGEPSPQTLEAPPGQDKADSHAGPERR